MKKFIAITALLCAMCVMFSCDNSSQPPVFKAGDDFAQAVSELKSGETLFVSDDVELDAPLTIPAGKDIVIQLLGDSEIEYEGSGSAFVVEEGAKLTIKGPASGSGKSKKDGAAEGAVIEADEPVDSLILIKEGAEVEIENVTLIGENIGYNSLICIENIDDEVKDMTTKLTLTNVNATADKSIIAPFLHEEAIDDGCSNTGVCIHAMNAEIVINGGTFTKTEYTPGTPNNKALYFCRAKVTMEDATVVSAGYPAVEIHGNNFGAAVMNNCTVTNNLKLVDAGANDWHGAAVAASYDGEIEITGGTYTGLYGFVVLPTDGKITCTGAEILRSIADSENLGSNINDAFISIDGTKF